MCSESNLGTDQDGIVIVAAAQVMLRVCLGRAQAFLGTTQAAHLLLALHPVSLWSENGNEVCMRSLRPHMFGAISRSKANVYFSCLTSDMGLPHADWS